MQIQLSINDKKVELFLEFLKLFRKDNIIEDYELINDSQNIHLNKYKTGKVVEIENSKEYSDITKDFLQLGGSNCWRGDIEEMRGDRIKYDFSR